MVGSNNKGIDKATVDKANKFFMDLMKKAAQEKASDIHVVVGKRPTLKANGERIEVKDLDKTTVDMVKVFLARFRGNDPVRNREVVNASFVISALGKRFRIHGYPSHTGYTLALRVIPLSIPELSTLNLPKELEKITKERKGLVLVTGSTGSGKSTTIASLLDQMNRNGNKRDLVVTVEEPVEFVYEDVNSFFVQMEVGKDVESFERAVADCMRKDPDIIVIGELQDKESIQQAIKLAETDHLVIGSLHASGAPEALDRVLKYLPEEQSSRMKQQLYDSTVAVVHQQLVPSQLSKLVPVTELLWTRSAKVREVIDGLSEGNEVTASKIRTAMTQSRQDGCLTRDHSLAELVKDGKLELEDALKYSKLSRESFSRLIPR